MELFAQQGNALGVVHPGGQHYDQDQLLRHPILADELLHHLHERGCGNLVEQVVGRHPEYLAGVLLGPEPLEILGQLQLSCPICAVD